jgi:CubicO group peptidase (beta-lactamase class C family)
MRRDTIFRMASTSRPVAMAAAMVLLDECRLRLDDPAQEWRPSFRHAITKVSMVMSSAVS